MNRKIVGIFICLLVIATVLPVAGDVSENENEPPTSTGWLEEWLYIGFITNLDESRPGHCTFNAVLLYYSYTYLGEVYDRGILIGTYCGGNYDSRNGFVGQHFICCSFFS